MIRGKKGDGEWWKVVSGIIAVVVLIAVLVAFGGGFQKVWGAIKDAGDKVIGDTKETFAKMDIISIEKTVKDREKSEKARDETRKKISDYLANGECGLVENEFKNSVFRLDAQREKYPENVDSILRDIKQDYSPIIECYTTKRNDCDAAYGFYISMKDQGSVFNLGNTNDKEVLGNSLFDIAVCYKDNKENDHAKKKFDEFFNLYEYTNKYTKASVDNQLKELSEENTGVTSDLRAQLTNFEREKENARYNYDRAKDFHRLGRWEESKEAFNKFISNFEKFKELRDIRQLLANAHYYGMDSELKFEPGTIYDICELMKLKYEKFRGAGLTSETFLEGRGLINTQFLIDIGKCYETEDDRDNAAFYYSTLFINHFKTFQQNFNKPNCKAIKDFGECNTQNEFFDISKVSGNEKYGYKCYYYNTFNFGFGVNECRTCFKGMTCSDYQENWNFMSSDNVCTRDPCNLGCSWSGAFCRPKQ